MVFVLLIFADSFGVGYNACGAGMMGHYAAYSSLFARVAKSLVDSWLLAFACVQTVFWVRGVQFSVAEVLIIHGSWHLRAFRASSESRECSFQLPRRRLAHGPGI